MLRRLALAGLAPIGGCALIPPAPQSAALALAPPSGLAPRRELPAVPFFAQTQYQCGPAALATVLVHAGVDANPERLAEQVFLPAREGSLQLEMLAGARRAQLLPVRLPRTMSALLAEVDAGHPVVVLQNLGLPIYKVWHYAVLVGYDVAAREVVLRSGATEREVLSWDLFERTWARSGYWAFVVSVPGRLPPTALETDAVDAALGFERAVASPGARAAVYDSVVARWPDNLAALIGQGNARAELGDWPGAARSFEHAARHHDSAAAWHNLGLARWRLGEREAARAAAQRALARAIASEPAWRDAAHRLVEQTGAAP
ncbi:MAG: PA2778 family cysteine peptidase [Aquincola sp.]|nr:PA2778 family cysteine peptidase [Aquincola sp.]